MDDKEADLEFLLAALNEEESKVSDPLAVVPAPCLANHAETRSDSGVVGDVSTPAVKITEDPNAKSINEFYQREIKRLQKQLEDQQTQLNKQNHAKTLQTSPSPGNSKRLPRSPISSPKKKIQMLFGMEDDDGVFVLETKNAPVAKVHPKDLKLSDIGLSESDDEDEPSLSKSGRDLKRKLDLQSAEEEETRKRTHLPQKMTSEHKERILGSPFQVSAVSSSTGKTIEICPFSGLRIIQPTSSMASLRDIIGSRKMNKLADLPVMRNTITKQTDWVTIGVVINKLPPKPAANGSKFAVWKISDLENTTRFTSLFLFADAATETCKITVRSVIAILNPSIMAKKDEKADMAISTSDPRKIVLMGFAQDMGICKGKSKSGDVCTNLVNTGRNEHCVYHLKAAHQKMSSQRMDLQANYSGTQPKSSKMAQLADGVIYGGKMFSQPSAIPPVQKVAPKMPLTKEAQRDLDEARRFAKKRFSEKEKETLDKLTSENKHLNTLIVDDGPGTRNLVRSYAKLDSTRNPAKFVSPSELLKSHKASMDTLMAAQKAKTLAITGAAPKLGRGMSSDRTITLRPSPEKLLTRSSSVTSSGKLGQTQSKARAIAKLQKAGKNCISKSDPNRMSHALSAIARERVQKILPTSLDAPELSIPTAKQICNLRDDPEIQALLKETSLHDDLNKIAEIDYMDKYFQRSEATEALEEQMEQTKEIECAVVTCKKCKYTATSLSKLCLKEKHEHIRHKAVKRFFKCKNCSKRKPSFDLQPNACTSCGQNSFERCGMLAYERKAPKLESEILVLRGEEHPAFLNT